MSRAKVKPQLQIPHELSRPIYNKVKERMMEKATTNEDGSPENVEETIICAICSVRAAHSLLLVLLQLSQIRLIDKL